MIALEITMLVVLLAFTIALINFARRLGDVAETLEAYRRPVRQEHGEMLAVAINDLAIRVTESSNRIVRAMERQSKIGDTSARQKALAMSMAVQKTQDWPDPPATPDIEISTVIKEGET